MKKVKRAFKITFVEYEDGSVVWQRAEQSGWHDFEVATLLQYVHDRLIEGIDAEMTAEINDLLQSVNQAE